MKLIACLLLLCACGGATDDALGEQPIDAAPDAEPAAPAKPVIPLCEGSPAESAELCQRLIYGTHGYCNRWIDCSLLH